jgi:hypothetical protein
MVEEILEHIDDRRCPAWRHSLPGAPSVDLIDQLGLDPDVDIGGFLWHAGEMGRCRAHPLDNSSQKVDSLLLGGVCGKRSHGTHHGQQEFIATFSMSRSAQTANRHHQAKPPLPPKVLAAFRRAPPLPHPLPRWGRAVRLGIDYALRVAIPDDDASDEAIDSFVWNCIVLAAAAKADLERGDPPPTCTALKIAEAAGPDYSRAYDLLGTIRDCSAEWLERGWATPALPAAIMAILQRAARAEKVEDEANSRRSSRPPKSSPSASPGRCSRRSRDKQAWQRRSCSSLTNTPSERQSW